MPGFECETIAGRKPRANPDDFESCKSSAMAGCGYDILSTAGGCNNKDNAHLVASLVWRLYTVQKRMRFWRKANMCDFTNLGGIRIYDVAVFGLVPCIPEEIVKDTESLVRRNTKKVFEKAKEENRSTRSVALEIFKPDTFDTPDI